MTNATNFAIISLAGFIIFGLTYTNALAVEEGGINSKDHKLIDSAKAIPDWIQFTMEAYLNGDITERELLDAFKFLLDRGILHMSQTAAQQMADLRAENDALKKDFKKLQADGIVGPKTSSATPGYKFSLKDHDSSAEMPTGSHVAPSQTKVILMSASAAAMCTGERSAPFIPGGQVVQGEISNVQVLVSPPRQSLGSGDPFAGDYYVAGATHTYTNDNGNRFLMVPVPQVFGGADENSSCWVRVSQTHADAPYVPSIITTKVEPTGEEIWTDEYGKTSSGDPDRPIITGNVPNPEQTGDMHLKGSKIHENTPAHDGGTVIVYTGLEFASETVHDLVSNEETSTTGWEEGVAAFTSKNYGSESTASGNKSADTLVVQELLNGFIVAINKEILVIEGEVAILEELIEMYTSTSTRSSTQYGESDFDFISRNIEKIDIKILSLQTGLRVLDDKLLTIGDDAKLANIDLQNSLQKQQQTLQTISNTSKMLHDTAKSIIQKID